MRQTLKITLPDPRYPWILNLSYHFLCQGDICRSIPCHEQSMKHHGGVWEGGSVWRSHFLTNYVIWSFISCGSCHTSEGCTLPVAFSQVTDGKLLTISHINISCVFITSFEDWSPMVDRGWWEMRTLVMTCLETFSIPPLDGNLHYVLSWDFSTPWTVGKPSGYSHQTCLLIRKESIEVLFSLLTRRDCQKYYLLWTQSKSNLIANIKHGFYYPTWHLLFFWGTETL